MSRDRKSASSSTPRAGDVHVGAIQPFSLCTGEWQRLNDEPKLLYETIVPAYDLTP